MPAGTQVASLFGVLSLDDKDFKRGVEGAETKMQGLAGSLGGMVGGIGKAAAMGATAIVGATAAIGVGMFELAKDAAPIEGIRKAFEGIATASGKSADETLKALADSSKGMIKNTDLMMSYNSAAQLVSTEFANQLPEAMQYLTKVAAATGQDMGFMMDSLVKGVGRASPMILDNLGIQVNLTEATEEYAKKVGKSADQLSKSEIQTAIMNKTLEQLKKNTAAMPDVTDNAATKWGAFQTRLANFKDDVGVKLLPFFETVISLLMKIADAVLPLIIPVIEQVSGAFSTFVGVLGNFGNILANQGIGEAIAAIINPLWQLLGLVGTDDMAQGAETAATGIITAFITVKEFFENRILPPLQKFADWFTGDVLPAVVGFITGTVVPAIGQFIQTLIRIWNDVSPFISKLADWFISDVLPVVVHYIQDVVIKGIQNFIDILVSIWTLVQPELQKLYDWFITTGLPAIQDILKGIVDNFIKPFVDILAGIMLAVGPVLGELKDWFVKDGLPAIQDFIKGAMDNFITPLINLLKGLWDAVKPGVEGVFNWFRDVFSKIGDFIKPVVDFIQSIVDKAKEALDMLRQLGGGGPTSISSGNVGSNFGVPSFGGKRAGGGQVAAGMSYLVGDGGGPELFTPSVPGNISTASETAGMMGGFSIYGGVHIHANSEAEGYAAMGGVLNRARAQGY